MMVLLFGKGEVYMSESKVVIENLSSITAWANQLVELDDSIWFKPIAEGKASIAEIISHLMYWDRYFITDVVPSVQRGEGIVFPDFDPANAIAYEYARSGISKKQLLDEFCATRVELCKLLLGIDEDILRKPTTVNGVAFCPHTGSPYSLLYNLQESIDHDNHHKSQIDSVL
jgi:hypothetical protein